MNGSDMITMLYKAGGRELIWGIKCETGVFPDETVDAMLAAGWVRNPLELEQKQAADTNSDGQLSADEAKSYLDSIGVSYDGMHWKAVVKLAKEHQLKGE